MPCFRLETNIPKSKVPPNFLKLTSAVLAKILGKPESYCVVMIIPEVQMLWGGGDEPCGYATLMSIGKLGVEENKKLSATLYDHIEEHLGISQTRLYIAFHDEAAANIGYNGTTFHEIFGRR